MRLFHVANGLFGQKVASQSMSTGNTSGWTRFKVRSKGELAMFELIKRLVTEEEGQDLVEYALLLVFIALIVIAALPNLGKTVSNVFSNATSVLQSGS
jgi:pilus assembly protein Flp/PilA